MKFRFALTVLVAAWAPAHAQANQCKIEVRYDFGVAIRHADGQCETYKVVFRDPRCEHIGGGSYHGQRGFSCRIGDVHVRGYLGIQSRDEPALGFEWIDKEILAEFMYTTYPIRLDLAPAQLGTRTSGKTEIQSKDLDDRRISWRTYGLRYAKKIGKNFRDDGVTLSKSGFGGHVMSECVNFRFLGWSNADASPQLSEAAQIATATVDLEPAPERRGFLPQGCADISRDHPAGEASSALGDSK